MSYNERTETVERECKKDSVGILNGGGKFKSCGERGDNLFK